MLWFKGPASYTGEDAAELHLHGGTAVVDAVTDALQALGHRPAEPGEFTRRAFEHGKLDLTQAEAVADLVDAETEAQRQQALLQLDGALGRAYASWRTTLVESLAWLEAEIDFPDEDLPGGLRGRVGPALERLLTELDAALADSARGERIREGYRIAVVGAPNAGKSTLFNTLVGREAAIVTDIAGTTRDVIEAPLTLGGHRVLLADTAGLREAHDPVEVEGVRRAQAWARDAALRLWIVDGAGADEGWNDVAGLVRHGDIVVVNKADLEPGRATGAAIALAKAEGLGVVRVSARDGGAIGDLRQALAQRVVTDLTGAEFPSVTRARHKARLEEARGHLTRGLQALDLGPELAAEDLRLAARALGRVAGRVDAEDVLDVVFASFCIGK